MIKSFTLTNFMHHALDSDLAQAVRALKNGFVVGMPTETVYGLAADATNPQAVAEIFRIKGRPFFDPLIVHIASIEEVPLYASEFPEAARLLAHRFWPGPLTLILPKRSSVPDLVTSGLPFVALRVPAHPVALRLLQEFGRPLAAPSANRFGRISPTTAAAVAEELGPDVPLILDGGPCGVGVESTIVSFSGAPPVVLRPGGITLEEIQAVVGSIEFPQMRISGELEPSLSPGTSRQHYSPRTPLYLVESLNWILPERRSRAALLGWGELDGEGFAQVRNLSPRGHFTEAASQLFTALRELDSSGVEEILVVLLPEEDLGRAINDRLRRAAHELPS